MNTQPLRDYVTKVLDTNKDGKVSIKDFIDLFPSFAVAIAVVFVDLVVAAAEYRVWDVGFQITKDPYKAIGFVLVSAFPFYLGQIFWLYPVANLFQKNIAVGFVATSLYTSWTFGTADLSMSYDIKSIVAMVTNLTAGYIVAGLAYIIVDDSIKAHRMKKQAEGAARQETDYQIITRSILRELAKTQALQRETEAEFEDVGMVQNQVDRLRGTKAKKETAPVYQPAMTANAATVDAVQLDPKVPAGTPNK